MIAQVQGTPARAASLGAQWPQYRKFSAALDARTIVMRTSVVAVALAATAAAFMTDRAPAEAAGTQYVVLPRVEIVGKREHARDVAGTRNAAPQPAIKFVRGEADRH